MGQFLLQTLQDLGAEEFKEFKWYLWQKGALEDFPSIPKCELENTDRMDTVDEMLKTYCINTIKVTVMVLKKMSKNDLVQNIPETMKEPAGKETLTVDRGLAQSSTDESHSAPALDSRTGSYRILERSDDHVAVAYVAVTKVPCHRAHEVAPRVPKPQIGHAPLRAHDPALLFPQPSGRV
uniref:Pyrin domain-containing protein n=1 Tax=Stegastes partitus TaxID=144197 RepID=A0A3B5BE52_9TELE